MTEFFVAVLTTMITGTYDALTATGTIRTTGTITLVFVLCCPHFSPAGIVRHSVCQAACPKRKMAEPIPGRILCTRIGQITTTLTPGIFPGSEYSIVLVPTQPARLAVWQAAWEQVVKTMILSIRLNM